MPRGRDPRLGEVLAGIVVVGGQPADAVLEGAWAPLDVPPDDPPALLLPHVDASISDPVELLRRAAASLRRAGGLPDTVAELERHASLLPKRTRTAIVPYVPEPVTDGAVASERPWSYAALLPVGETTVSVLSDGGHLRFAGFVATGGRLRLVLADELAGERRVQVEPGRAERARGHTATTLRDVPGGVRFVVRLDRFALGGDPYPTRVFGFNAAWTKGDRTATFAPAALDADGWPAPDGALVVGR
jgi:hypothetical protein